jgi:hypothetical protein
MTDWPEDPYGDMVPILKASIEAAKARHPSGKTKEPDMVSEWVAGQTVGESEPVTDEAPVYANILTAADRCDHCGAAAVYRVMRADLAINDDLKRSGNPTLDFCLHHQRKHFPGMLANGWTIVGTNAELAAAMGGEEG